MTNREQQLSPEQFASLTMPLREKYVPAEDVLEQVGHVHATTVSGALGVGKSSVINASGLHRVVARTTREKRQNDGKMEQDGVEYFFDTDLSQVYDEVATGRYVQWAVHPKTHAFYGTKSNAYPDSGPALIDVMATSVPSLRAVRGIFASMASTYLVVENFATMSARFDGRGSLAPHERRGRLEESVLSLEFGLDDSEMEFIVNNDLGEAARRLVSVAERREEPDPVYQQWARNCGFILLNGIKDELGLPRPL